MQVLQQPLMQRREGGKIPAGAPPHLHVCQGELSAGKRLQDARARRPRRGASGRALIEARDGFLRLLQTAPYLRFQQGQQSQRQGQKPCQTDDLLRLPDKQRAQAQGEVFEEMEIPFERPATPIVLDSLDQGQSVRRSIGDLDAPPQAMPPGGNGFLVPLYAGEGIADLDLGSSRTIRATPPPP